MRSRGDPAAYNTDRLSPRQRCPLQWYSQPIVCPVCGQNLAFLVYTVMWIDCRRFRYLQYCRVRSRQQGPPRHTLTTHGRYTTECSSSDSSSGSKQQQNRRRQSNGGCTVVVALCTRRPIRVYVTCRGVWTARN